MDDRMIDNVAVARTHRGGESVDDGCITYLTASVLFHY